MSGPTEAGEIRRVDCDIHPIFKGGLRDLTPYLTDNWLARFGMKGPVETDQFGGKREASIETPRSLNIFPVTGAFRKDAIPPGGGLPASDPVYLGEHHLDPNGIDRGLLLGQNMLTVGAYPQSDYATTLASAYNDWIEERWLEVDSRYRGTIVVATQDPQAAAAEVRRCAERCDRWVGVMLSLQNKMMGDSYYHPVYAEAERLGLPICVHISGVEGTFPQAPPLPAGVPATYFEVKTIYTTVYQANLVSMVARGTFTRTDAFPRPNAAPRL